MADVAGVGDATEHEEAQVVRMDGNIAIDNLGGLVAVVKGLTHEVDVFCERQARAVAKHDVVHP
jgi:hypothetical protein